MAEQSASGSRPTNNSLFQLLPCIWLRRFGGDFNPGRRRGGRRLKVLFLRGKQSGSRRYISVTQVVRRKPCARSFALDCVVRNKKNTLFDSAAPQSLEDLVADPRGQSDFRQCACDVCHRPVYALVYRRCDKGVDVSRIRPALNDCHA